MGFTKKSLLAMVLALVMVIGMAMPTALAAAPAEPTTTGAGFFFFGEDDSALATKLGTAATTDEFAIEAGGKAAKLFMYNGDVLATAKPLTSKALGAAPKVTVVNQNDSLLSITKGDGFLTLTPGVGFQGSSFFTVTIESAKTDEDWGPDGVWAPNKYFEQKFYYCVKPVLKASGNIVLDINPSLDPQQFMQKLNLTSLPSEEITFPSGYGFSATKAGTYATTSTGLTGLTVSTSATNASSVPTLPVYASATAANEGSFWVKAKIGDKDAAPIEVHYSIGDSSAGKAYKVVGPTTAVEVNRNAANAARTFAVKVTDSKNNAPSTAPTLANIGITLGSVDKIATSDGKTPATATLADIVTASPWEADNEGTVVFTFANNLISFEGKLIASYTGCVSAEIPFKVNPVDLGPSNDIALNYDLKATDDPKYTVTSSTLVKGTAQTGLGQKLTFADAEVAKLPTGVKFYLDDADSVLYTKSSTSIPTFAKITFTADRTNASLKDSEAVIKFTGTVGASPSPVISCTPLKLNLIVKDITTKSVLSVKEGTTAVANGGTVKFDLNAGMNAVNKDLIVAGAGGIVPNDKDIDYSSLAVTYSSTLTSGTDLIVTKPTAAGENLNIVAKKRAKGYITLKGTIGGIPFTPFKINVEIGDTTPDVANHIVTTIPTTGITMSIIDDPVSYKIEAVDVNGDSLPTINPGAVTFLDEKGNAVASGSEPFTPANVSGTTTWTFTPKTGGVYTMVIKDKVSTPGTEVAEPLKIPVTVKALEVTAAPSTFLNLNLKDDLTKKLEIVLTIPEKFANEAVVLNVADTNGANAFDTSWATQSGYYTATTKKIANKAKAVAKGKLTITGTVKGVAFGKIEIPYEIKNDKAIISTPAVNNFKFEMKAGGTQDATLTFSGNPSSAAFVLASVTSTDTAVVSVANVTGNQYKFTALKAGSGSITVKGTVGGDAVADLVIPFTVTGDDTKPSLTVAPTGNIALSLKEGGKKTETLAFTSSDGSIEAGSLKIVAAPTGIVDIATAEPWVITAKAQGKTTLTVTAKIGGKETAPLSIIVTVDQSIVTSDFSLDGVEATTASLQVRNSTANNQRKLTLNGVTGAVKWKTSDKSIVKFISAPAGKASQTVDGTAEQWIQVLKTGKVTITATPSMPGATAKSITFTIKTEAESGFTPPTNTTLVIGQRMSAYPAIIPATAKTKGFTFKSSPKSIATITSSGTITAKAAGTATITVKSKKKGGESKTFTVTVLADYKSMKFNSIALLQNSGTLTNKDAAEVKTILDSAKFADTATANAANMLPAAATKAEVEAAIKAVVAGDNDVTVFYFSGTAAASTGLALGGNTSMTFGELANNLATIRGNIVVFLDCKGGSRMINTKAASESDIFAAFAKASKVAGLKEADKTMRPKFTVFTATDKGSRALGAGTTTTTEYSSKFTSAFVAALRTDATTKKMLADTSGDGLVSIKELRAALIKKSAAGKYVKVYYSYKSVLPIYGNVQPTVVPAT